jgi:hypothetical protein
VRTSPPRPSGHIIERPKSGDRQLQMLLTLGLLGPMRAHQLKRVVATDLQKRMFYYHLEKLAALGFLWLHPLADPLGNQTLQQPWLLGLTPAGAARLAEFLPVDPKRLILKEGKVISSQRAIWSHMLDQADFLTRLIAEVRRHPALLGLQIRPEFTALRVVRIDALVTFRFAKRGAIDALSMDQRRPWWVPWLLSDGGAELYPYDDHFHIEKSIALEVDRSTEEIAIIENKGRDYRDAFMQAPWRSWLQEFPVPAFLVRSESRLKNIHAAWQRGWWGTRTPGPHQTSAVLAATFPRLAKTVIQGDWVDNRGNIVDLFRRPHTPLGLRQQYEASLAPDPPVG